jgi:hypothetical protein
MQGTYEVSPHLLDLNLDCAKGLAEELALVLWWRTYCGHRRCRRCRWAQAYGLFVRAFPELPLQASAVLRAFDRSSDQLFVLMAISQ